MPVALTFLADKLADDFAEGAFDNEVPDSLIRNLNPALPLRPYQAHALAVFRYYWEEIRARRKVLRDKPAHLLFNMATGSGKTLLMAANMLALYAEGYRRFVFVVDSKNIVEKTRANFTEPGSPKYLFAPQVVVAGRAVPVVAVESFEGTHPDDLSILFTTIQKLQGDLRTPREEGLSYEDLAREKLVLLADEAHHFNKATRSRQDAEQEESTWESTIGRLLRQRPDNALLEYTATVDFSDRALAEKYADKLLVRYSLKEFRQDGYSKEIRLLKSGEPRWARVAQALLLSQWRLKVYNAANPGLHSPYAPFKPVVLFKSPSIAESKAFFQAFGEWLDELNGEQLTALTTNAGPTLSKALAWFQAHGLPLARLADELREAFRTDRCIIVNSQDDSEAKQLELNRLEEGPIRAVFTVQMLTEGWDVLNLYDIVRLDESNGVSGSARNPKPTKATTQEAQLLGRGARYFPWQRPADAEPNRRKLDKDLGNPLRCLEELYYHSINDSTYVAALTKELVEAGIYDPSRDDGTPRTVRVKPAFKQLPIWETGLLYTNERVRTGSQRRVTLQSSLAGTSLGIRYVLPPDGTAEATVFDPAEAVAAAATTPAADQLEYQVPLAELGIPVLRKALERYSFFEFSRLRQLLPQLTSVRELLTSLDYLGASTFTLVATAAQRQGLRPHQKLAAAQYVFQELQTLLGQKLSTYVGSTAFVGKPLKSYLANDRVTVAQDGGNPETALAMSTHPDAALRLDVANADWLIYDEFYGTSEEKHFIKYLAAALPELRQRFQDIYLLRNDKLFQLYNFDDGRPFEPDFVLFLTEVATGQALSWQVFVEPKGEHLRLNDAWKETFLLSIEARATNGNLQLLFENNEVRLHGLPFYTHSREAAFEASFKTLLVDSV
ncbi:DEAD/DEAH box helicase family protein [Hymenobacter latericus]|uniref:DEAD/DEAH box helicase family protein n=1 Tax=Hymenobacter sp. YIM 151858-1 TaxID=2987688 RepID=UPI002225F4DB|nr:DEAD/DEAH box helicase family protein [Hymenobacter sp. YIM 151858-1]UYZ58170.1 DEAD/DEAH box helicase family protein [Hymenobacter sp. YIM 151858-1]